MMTRRQFLLTKLMEECAEVAQRASKQSRFGTYEAQPGQSTTNKDRLNDEILDLKAIVVLLREEGELPPNGDYADFAFEMSKRRERIEKYYRYSQECGMTEPDLVRTAPNGVDYWGRRPRCKTHNRPMVLQFYSRPGSADGNGWGCPDCEEARRTAIGKENLTDKYDGVY